MKAVIFLISSFFIILKSGWDYSECNIRSANQALTPKIWFEQTIDGKNQDPLITRFYHNKAGTLGAELSHCYLEKVSPGFFFDTSGIFGTIFLIYFIYNLANSRKWKYLAVLFLMPTVPILSFNQPTSEQTVNLIAYLYKGFAVFGLAAFLFRK